MAPQNKPFTVQDAQSVIVLARRAPLQHMDEAEAAAGLLTRFAEWVNVQFQGPTAPSTSASPANQSAGTVTLPDGSTRSDHNEPNPGLAPAPHPATVAAINDTRHLKSAAEALADFDGPVTNLPVTVRLPPAEE